MRKDFFIWILGRWKGQEGGGDTRGCPDRSRGGTQWRFKCWGGGRRHITPLNLAFLSAIPLVVVLISTGLMLHNSYPADWSAEKQKRDKKELQELTWGSRLRTDMVHGIWAKSANWQARCAPEQEWTTALRALVSSLCRCVISSNGMIIIADTIYHGKDCFDRYYKKIT